MKLKKPAIIAICAVGFAILLPFTFVPQANAFDEPDILTRQIKPTTIKGESIDQVLDLLAVDYRIPVGIELGDPKLAPRREIEVDLPATNLKDFLDSVIVKDPRYTWKLEGGVIHLRPVTAYDSVVTTLLDTNISHFGFTGKVSRYHIHYEILNLPEIRSQLVVAGVDPLMFQNFSTISKLRKNTFFSESNLTLRELLDQLVLKTEIKRWVITRWGENSEFITLRS